MPISSCSSGSLCAWSTKRGEDRLLCASRFVPSGIPQQRLHFVLDFARCSGVRACFPCRLLGRDRTSAYPFNSASDPCFCARLPSRFATPRAWRLPRSGSSCVVEEGEELVILLLRDRVELVVVTLAQPTVRPSKAVAVVFTRSTTARRGIAPVDAALLVDQRVAMEAGRDLLLQRRVRAAGRRRVARW